MNLLKRFLSSKYFQPVISLLALIETSVIAVVGWIINQNTSNDLTTKNSLIILLCVVEIVTLLVVLLLSVSISRKDKRNKIITKLCKLQNTYIMAPNFVTSQEHTKDSKEKDLADGGTAKIITNSLTYDLSSSDEIVQNIINGAKYIYILPNTNTVIDSLEQYILAISNQFSNPIQCRTLLETNIEFWFFDKEITCLYNFASLRQTTAHSVEPFDQAWWYINPKDNSPSSYMLTKEIQAENDKETLSEVFSDLEKCTTKYTGKEIFDNSTSLHRLIGR